MDTPVPIRFCETERLDDDTHVVRQLAGEGLAPVAMYVNSMVITGEEPIVVDCGPALTRDEWLNTVFGLVDPADVRWIYLSHDDADHVGNLYQVLDLCPQATLVTTWFMSERLSADHGMLPMHRLRWVNDGESFTAGDRELVAVTPPTFDSPTTRGLYDTKSGIYWAADSFGVPVLHEVDNIAELDPGFWRDNFSMVNRILSPWHQWLDPAKYQVLLDKTAALGARTVASAHGPALHGGQINSGLSLLSELPYLPPAPLPGQAELEALIAAFSAPPAADAEPADTAA